MPEIAFTGDTCILETQLKLDIHELVLELMVTWENFHFWELPRGHYGADVDVQYIYRRRYATSNI